MTQDQELEPDTSDIPEAGPEFFKTARLVEPKKRKARKKRYRPTHGVQLGDGDIAGVDQGFRCFHVLKVARKWVYLVHTADQTLKKCEIEHWKTLLRRSCELDHKGRRKNATS